MISFWNITSDKLSSLEIKETEEKIIFVSDSERIYTDFNGKRTEYRDIVYIQDINDVPEEDSRKNLLYFELNTKNLYFYSNDSYFLLGPGGVNYVGKYTSNTPDPLTTSVLNNYVLNRIGRESKINDLVIDSFNNNWLKVDNEGDEHDWIIVGSGSLPGTASYSSYGSVMIKENCGIIVENGILSLNLLDENRDPGQIVILNEEGQIDEDLYESGEIQWKIIQ